ncbi:MAG: type II toxin-antitoxin system PemK/MazF family toxin [Planctomycetia bacterium]|nr:type II toxin-antitoxin system PemK/MazF family toxin [Planctomycetia bacterium]
MNRGEVWRVRLPFRSGHAQAGDRPAVIVQAEQYGASLTTILTVPFTGQVRAARRFPGTVLVQPDGTNGLTVPSVALVFQLVALDRRDFLMLLGVLDSAALDLVLQELDRLTGR